MDNLQCHFPDGAIVRVNQDISLTIKRPAFGQQFADLCLWIRILQQRPVRLQVYPLPDFFR